MELSVSFNTTPGTQCWDSPMKKTPDFDAAADSDFAQFRVRQIGNHEEHRLLLELDHDIDVRDLALEAGDARLMHHGEAVDRAAAADRCELQALRGAALADGARRMVVVAALGASLRQQPALLRRVPERLREFVGNGNRFFAGRRHGVSLGCVSIATPRARAQRSGVFLAHLL